MPPPSPCKAVTHTMGLVQTLAEYTTSMRGIVQPGFYLPSLATYLGGYTIIYSYHAVRGASTYFSCLDLGPGYR